MTVCDNLVALFEASKNEQGVGRVGTPGGPMVDKSTKDSIEMGFAPNDTRPAWKRYAAALRQVTSRYVAKYPFSGSNRLLAPWDLTSSSNFQSFPPGGGFKIFHTERQGKPEPAASRHLVYMTYLNDVTDLGGTEVCHFSVNPRSCYSYT